MIHPFSISADDSVLLIIDLQEKLSRVLNQSYLQNVCANINLLTTLAAELKIPVLLTEQYPEGLGPTIEPIKKILNGKKFDAIDKLTFSGCGDEGFSKKLKSYRRKKIILVGMETHVCVYLTALDLLSQKYQPFVAADAVISRSTFNYKNGLSLLRESGAVVANTETLLFQLMVRSGTSTFKKISALLKQNPIS